MVIAKKGLEKPHRNQVQSHHGHCANLPIPEKYKGLSQQLCQRDQIFDFDISFFININLSK
jgi:hypothetical protein